MQSIESKILSVSVSSFGAELQSVKNKITGKEYIWCADKNVWNGKAPVLFPICGRLSNDIFYYNGKEYNLQKHGFARKNEFVLDSIDDNSVSYSLCSNENFYKSYPFDFKLTVSFIVEDNKLKTIYKVFNSDDKTIYFSLGAHPAYNVEIGGKIVFENKQDLITLTVNNDGLLNGEKLLSKNNDTIVLENDTFINDALIFDHPKSSTVTIKSSNDEDIVKMSFGNIPYLLIWAKPGANYVCIEPWNGIPDYEGNPNEIKDKKGIVSLEKGKSFEFVTEAEFI